MVLEDLDDDAIVISGISGKFPNSDNIEELMENLMNGVDCISDNHTRWSKEYQIQHRIGTMRDIAKLDHIFFGISSRLATSMDPVIRLLTMSSFEAVLDAGLNPADIRGSEIAVFGSLSFQESDKSVLYQKYEPHGLGMLGTARTMAANRLSVALNTTGPSCTIMTECAGSAIALKRAFEFIKSGYGESAIVDSGVLTLFPFHSYQLNQLGLLAKDGINRSFDAKASGFSRSESVGVLFLQKAKHAKRIYAEISAINVEYGDTIIDNPMILTNANFQAQIMKKTLKDCGVKPSEVTYVEADGTAVKIMDREELKAIDLVYGQDRSPSNPLLIGSVKSNIGHSSCTNTINSIIKVLIAMEKDTLPPNLHYDEPPEDAKCLQDGRVKVVTERTPWTEGYAAVNTSSYTGCFSHVILKRHSKNKKKRDLSTQVVPRLFTVSARNKEMISAIFNSLNKNRKDEEWMQVINDIMIKSLNNSLFRGYMVIPSTEITESNEIVEEIVSIENNSRDIYFVFSGMGSQWIGMGQTLMKIPIFAEAIKKCDSVLKPRGYDIVHIICDNDPTIYDNIINSFLGIAAIQIGLVDILYAVGVKPTYMIGHSVGELGCSYADGCFTAEEMILSALSRGLASVESDLIDGSMAAIDLGYENVKHLCPKDIDVACHNGPTSSTISGPAESIKAFVKELKSKGRFAKIVPTSNIAFHSRYISPAGPKLLDYLKKVIPEPKQRSKRWISTSFPKNKWSSLKARFSSPEYHTNNLLSPVLFEEVLQIIPQNAVTIEISPHGLLQAILRESLSSTCINLALTKRNAKDNATLLLSTLGKLYNLGVHVTPGNLCPRFPYPVSKDTPSFSSLVRWEHSNDWNVCYHDSFTSDLSSEKTYVLNLKSNEYEFLNEFRIGEDIIIPSSVYLWLVYDIYSSLNKKTKNFNYYFIFENIVINDLLLKVPKSGVLSLKVTVMKASGRFEILKDDDTIVATGTVFIEDKLPKQNSDMNSFKEKSSKLTGEDFYTDLLFRGYKYGEFYKSVNELNALNGQLVCKDKWISLLEGLFQVQIFNTNNKHILMPSTIRKIVIDIQQLEKDGMARNVLPMEYRNQMNFITCRGIEMTGVEFQEITTKDTSIELLADEARFIPNVNEKEMDPFNVCHVVLGLISENIRKSTTGRMTILKESGYDNNNIFECFGNISKVTKYNNIELKSIAKGNINKTLGDSFTLMIIEEDVLFKEIRNIINNISKESFLLTVIKTEGEKNAIATLTSVGFNILLKIKITPRRTVLLLQKTNDPKRSFVVENRGNCIDQLKTCLRQSKYDNVIFLVNTTIEDNVFEILRDLKRESGYKKLQIFDLQDTKAPQFSLENKFYTNQIKLNLRQNVLSPNGVWGTYRWMPLPEKSTSPLRWQASIDKSGSLTWMEDLPLIKEENKCIVKVECSAFDLNAYEYWLQNEVNLESQISITEYSGTDENGRRVMGLVDSPTISNEILTDPDFTWNIPDALSFEDAATMPQAYLAAFCSLHTNSFRFALIKTVLIHFGASDVGQALINLSLSYNFDVYTTYETEAERRVIESIRPRLPQSHIIHVEHHKARIITIMKDKSIDLIVVNYSMLNDINSSLYLIGDYRDLVTLRDSNHTSDRGIGLFNFERNVSMYSYSLQDLFKLSSSKKRQLAELMRTALKAGTLKPIISRRLNLQEKTKEMKAEVCERFGKVIVYPLKQIKSIQVVPRLCFNKDKCYLIVEGLDRFGVQLMKWMIDEGVTKLFIVSKTAHKEIGEYNLKKFSERGVRVVLRVGVDLTDATAVKKLLKEAESMGQLGAIFDLHRTSAESVPSSSLNSTAITRILDQECKKLCPLLENFIVFSFYDKNEDLSKVSMVEKICEQRIASGQDGLFVLLPTLFPTTQSGLEKEFYLKKLDLFQRMRILLKERSSMILLYHKILKESTAIENENQETDNVNNEQVDHEMELFEKYIYTYKNHGELISLD